MSYFLLMIYKKYHTDLILQFKLKLLPVETVKSIPHSTRHNWNKRNMTQLFGYDAALASEGNMAMIKDFLSRKRLMKCAKALYFVHQTYAGILNSLKRKKKIMKDNKKVIIDTIERIKNDIGFKRALNFFGISYQRFYTWKKEFDCKSSLPGLCRLRHVNQLSAGEEGVIKKYLTDARYMHWSVISVYWRMMRDNAAAMCISTFYKYSALLNLKRMLAAARNKKNCIGIRASKPLEILHMDVTVYRPLDHTKVFIHIIQDNFSRAILGCIASLKCSADVAVENLRAVCSKYNLHYQPLRLIVDDGPENKGKVNEFIGGSDVAIQKLVAQKDIVFSNSMVEAVNKRLKYDFLFTKDLMDFDETKKFVENIAVMEYCNKPHYALQGYTPSEVLHGAIPDRKRFKEQIIAAKLARKFANSSFDCKGCRE